MATLLIDPNRERLRFSCGQCGETMDFLFEYDMADGLLKIKIFPSVELPDGKHSPEVYVEPVHVIGGV